MADLPSMNIKGKDSRAKAYEKIAKVHKQVVEAKWRATTAGGQVTVSPALLIHCEESITFLAGELLQVRSMLERVLSAMPKEVLNEALGVAEQTTTAESQ